MPAELSQLKDLECFVKLPGDYPCTKLQTTFQTAPSTRVESFLLKPEKKRDYGASLAANKHNLSSPTTLQTQIDDIPQLPEIIPENKEDLI